MVDRRLRADRRDAAAAVVPRRRPLVAGQGPRPASSRCSTPRGRSRACSSTSRCPTRRSSPTSSGSCGNLIAMHEMLRDAERVSMRLVMTPDRMVVAEAHADVHLPEPVRVPDRRRGRQPRLPRRARPRATSAPGTPSSRSSSSSSAPGFSPVPVLQRAVLRAGGRRRPSARPARRRAVRRPRPRRRAARPARAGAARGQRPRRRCGWTCRSPPRATSRSRRSGSS